MPIGQEFADIVIACLDEHEGAKKTATAVKKYGKDALLMAVDISTEGSTRYLT